jgi:hypothetical protein
MVFIGSVVLLFAWLLLSPSLMNTPEPASDEAALEADIARIIAEAEGKPFVFTAVPDARTLITLPPPPTSNDIDTVVYNQLKATTTVTPEQIQDDVIFNLAPEGVTYMEYINSLEDPSEIFQLTDELRQLTLYFNQEYNRPPLSLRVPGVVQLAPLDMIVPNNPTQSVYPSMRAVDALLALEIMVRIDPDNAAAYEREIVALIQRGIGYGLYGQSDVDAAQSLVNQYMDLYTTVSVEPNVGDNL